MSEGMNWGSYEPITDIVNFDVLDKKYAALQIGMSRTFKIGVNLLIILKECNGMSQHSVIVANSK